MTLTEAIARIKTIYNIEPTNHNNNEATYELNGISLFTISGNALRINGHTYKIEQLDATTFEKDYQRQLINEAKEKIHKLLAIANTTVAIPEKIEATITNVDYSPGDKWSCGQLDIDALTNLGKFTYREIVPGPRHSDDSHELTITLDNHELDLDFLEIVPLDFDPPGKPGRTSDKFAETIDAEVANELQPWLEANKEVLARAVARAKADS